MVGGIFHFAHIVKLSPEIPGTPDSLVPTSEYIPEHPVVGLFLSILKCPELLHCLSQSDCLSLLYSSKSDGDVNLLRHKLFCQGREVQLQTSVGQTSNQ